VFAGPTPNLQGTPTASAKTVVHPQGTTLCNADLALLVLDEPVQGIAPMRVRVKSGVTIGETFRAVGYGQNDQNQPIGTRFRKDGVSVLAIGSAVSASMTALGSNEFEVGESMCEGDSGGPAIDETSGAIVGIVSRGGACTDTTGHVYTSLAGFVAVLQQAFAAAGGSWIDESAPEPGVDAGTGSSSNGGGSGVLPKGTAGYGGPANLHSGQGNTCAVTTSAGRAGRADLAPLALALGAFAVRRRTRRTRWPDMPSDERALVSPA
jgi:hypothetical protein